MNVFYDSYSPSIITKNHQVAVPESTVESKADMVHLRSRKYEEESDDWQQTVIWDRIQQRPSVSNARTDYDGVTPSEKLLNKRYVTSNQQQQ